MGKHTRLSMERAADLGQHGQANTRAHGPPSKTATVRTPISFSRARLMDLAALPPLHLPHWWFLTLMG